MNRYKSFLLATLLVLSRSLMAIAQQGGQFRVLVFAKTAGFRHQSIPNGVMALKKMGEKHVFSVFTSEDATQFTDENLAKFDAVVLSLFIIWMTCARNSGIIPATTAEDTT